VIPAERNSTLEVMNSNKEKEDFVQENVLGILQSQSKK
jgi:hypothetical protein